MVLDLLLLDKDPTLFIVMRGGKAWKDPRIDYEPVGDPFIISLVSKEINPGTSSPQDAVALEILQQQARHSEVRRAVAYHAGDPKDSGGMGCYVPIQLYKYSLNAGRRPGE